YEDEGSAIDRLGKVRRDAESWAEVDAELAEVVARLDAIHSDVQDVAHTLRRLGGRWEADPERLGEVEARLQQIKRLESKYRKSADELIVYRVGLDEQETRLQQAEDDLSGLEGEITSLFVRLCDAAAELSKQRAKVAQKLAKQVQQQLADLGM